MRKLISVMLVLTMLAGTFMTSCKSKAGENGTVSDNTDDNEAPVKEIDYSNLPREAAGEGIVLLENKNNSLPLKEGATVALFGKGQIDLIKGGNGSGDVKCEHVVGILEGLREKEKEGKIEIYDTLAKKYERNSDYVPSRAETDAAAAAADNAIFIITRNSGEGSDRNATPGDYYLSSQETSMLSQIGRAGFDNVIVILNVGGITDTEKINSNKDVDSLLLIWQPGQDGGAAAADVLVGDVNPSGKLTDTFAKSYDYYPSSAGFKESPDFVNYTEDIFVGYRYFETFDPEYSKVSYEFGYGLSYTEFELDNINTAEKDGSIVTTLVVKNTGAVAGKEVVQVYFSAPQGKLGKAARELAGYVKTGIIAPGESESVSISFKVSDMSSYDDTGRVKKSAYVLEAGDYRVYVGNSVKNAGERGAVYTYSLKDTVVTEQLTEQLTPNLLTERLLADGSYEKMYNTEGLGIALGTEKTRIEAEAYYAKHCHTEVRFNTSYKKCAMEILTSDAGNRYFTYALDVETGGSYSISLFAGSAKSTVADAVVFYVNDALQTAAALDFPATGGNWTFKETGTAVISLKKGLNFLKVYFKAGESFTGFVDCLDIEYKGSASALQSAGYESEALALAARAGAGIITLQQVYDDLSLMDSFIAQLSSSELAFLLHGHGESIPHGTGAIGGISKYGIPSAETADGPAGINLYTYTTAWPVETMLACTWNRELLYKVGCAIAAEATENKADIWLAPGMNIHRNPLCGRNFEYYSEDPLVTGTIAAAITMGVQDNGIGIVVKHFACNNKEQNRGYTDSRLSERALREIYLKGFEIVVKEADPWLVMTSYNKINGCETAESYGLVTEILKNEWKYNGVVTTDWWNDTVEFKELLAGNDLKMKSGDEAGVIGALNSGLITKGQLKASVRKILELVMKTKAMKRVIEPEYIVIEDGAVIVSTNCAWKSDAVGMEVCEDKNGGYNTTNTYEGQWISYYIDVRTAGTYYVTVRIASTDGSGGFDMYTDGAKSASFKNTVKTGGWQKWADSTTVVAIRLTEGTHELKLQFTQGGFNFNTLTFKAKK